MEIKATQDGMKEFTAQQLLDHVAAVDTKRAAAPPCIRRTSYIRWPSNRGAILREVARRKT